MTMFWWQRRRLRSALKTPNNIRFYYRAGSITPDKIVVVFRNPNSGAVGRILTYAWIEGEDSVPGDDLYEVHELYKKRSE